MKKRTSPRSSLSSKIIRSRDPTTSFARAVVSGRLKGFGKLAIAACARHLKDLKEGPKRGLVWSVPHARYAILFFARLKHSKGEFANRPLLLEPWQMFRVGCCFGWLRKEDRARRFRVSYNDVGRKNGKTTEAAGIGLLGLVADGEVGAEVYSTATKKDQARLVFDEAKRMVRTEPELREIVKRRNLNLSVAETDSKFEPLSSDVRSMDGLNPHFSIIDELHKHINRDLFDVMDTAVGARKQPLLWIITTAGDDNPETVYAQERTYAEQVVTGVLQDDSYFAWISCPDPEDRWDDPLTWKKGNPNLGVSVKLDDLERQARKAKGSPAAQRAFKRLRLNMRTPAAGRAIAFERWVLNTRGPIDELALAGRPCYVGIDLSSKLDLTAAVALFPPCSETKLRAADPYYTIIARFWCPSENVKDREDRDRASYERWIEEGWIEPTPGDIIDHSSLKSCVLEWDRLYEIRECFYDPWNATQLSIELQDAGIPVKEFIQGIKSYTAPTKEFLALVQGKKLEHGGNPVLAWMSNNLAIEEDKNKNQMPTKKKSTGRIDGMTGAIMATAGVVGAPVEGGYRDGGSLKTL